MLIFEEETGDRYCHMLVLAPGNPDLNPGGVGILRSDVCSGFWFHPYLDRDKKMR